MNRRTLLTGLAASIAVPVNVARADDLWAEPARMLFEDIAEHTDIIDGSYRFTDLVIDHALSCPTKLSVHKFLDGFKTPSGYRWGYARLCNWQNAKAYYDALATGAKPDRGAYLRSLR